MIPLAKQSQLNPFGKQRMEDFQQQRVWGVRSCQPQLSSQLLLFFTPHQHNSTSHQLTLAHLTSLHQYKQRPHAQTPLAHTNTLAHQHKRTLAHKHTSTSTVAHKHKHSSTLGHKHRSTSIEAHTSLMHALSSLTKVCPQFLFPPCHIFRREMFYPSPDVFSSSLNFEISGRIHKQSHTADHIKLVKPLSFS